MEGGAVTCVVVTGMGGAPATHPCQSLNPNASSLLTSHPRPPRAPTQSLPFLHVASPFPRMSVAPAVLTPGLT